MKEPQHLEGKREEDLPPSCHQAPIRFLQSRAGAVHWCSHQNVGLCWLREKLQQQNLAVEAVLLLFWNHLACAPMSTTSAGHDHEPEGSSNKNDQKLQPKTSSASDTNTKSSGGAAVTLGTSRSCTACGKTPALMMCPVCKKHAKSEGNKGDLSISANYTFCSKACFNGSWTRHKFDPYHMGWPFRVAQRKGAGFGCFATRLVMNS